ncbi:branched-chain amino acid aminotransferase [Aspergillus clavatus NRRL 1]|uniref:Branched-chain-amino-acid aminotransferase n=1 Tax=Aspergillus clavatus (strain ATCC 1007 / CBS 513.65 / DSM 816 / NCTC 3887 / NRRL 1 / QM 1276 / 107) TaxID=344612 RepID=A1CCC2_ASPCL|nr:branched-chain amino acid aminotransferase [Aspergillus clavatus NRRL 1]EAW12179.1 branched-chain amino acid aminotransferase [Aspergillus clavatus NRRL 1]
MAAKLEASKLHIIRNPRPSDIPNPADLEFGKHVTDHLLQIPWSEDHGWHAPRIVPYENLSLDPTAGVFHYGFECFEGMKAYKDAQGRIRLFRPAMNAARLNQSAARVALPTFNPVEFLTLLAKFVAIEDRHIPAIRGYSLYLRPVIIGTNPGLSVTPPTSALLYVLATPAGSYFRSGFKAITLEAISSSQWVRAWPGGSGSHKIGGNYAPCMVPELVAKQRGSDQVLWLFGEDNQLTEAGTMNLFIVLRRPDLGCHELVTPPLDGMILPGVNRDSVLSLARERLEPQGWLVRERSISIQELEAAAAAGNLEEVFGTGTAAVVVPVRCIRWAGRTINCGLSSTEETGHLAATMREWIEARQYGEEEHEWGVLVDDLIQAHEVGLGARL